MLLLLLLDSTHTPFVRFSPTSSNLICIFLTMHVIIGMVPAPASASHFRALPTSFGVFDLFISFWHRHVHEQYHHHTLCVVVVVVVVYTMLTITTPTSKATNSLGPRFDYRLLSAPFERSPTATIFVDGYTMCWMRSTPSR